MHHTDMYARWLVRRREAQVPPGFTLAVMDQVTALETRRVPAVNGLDRLAAMPWLGNVLRLAWAVGLSAIGVYRLSCVAARLFLPY